ncbi:sporulation integral membrane protein YlbJ [Paenibacillus shunpengii]|uniref:Sporulation integral membrane protein YlbJ n=1 Tax=Paenibacillus shunpengii TaxID=2054424 RepID=A0ABW5SSN3_9BACL|nr:sporulation integral membrane protein YlbJ [Paenibacillus sp. PDC88]SDX49244.1 sporulation integral membrane protein YlbJ [Paenibacillus sp. PDC88]
MLMKRLVIPLSIVFGLFIICIFMMIYPTAVWNAGVRGLSIWWDVLFPSLFPFFVISELLLGLGIVHFTGALLHPLMRPVFRIPGTGGFVAAISYASGYPIGAKLTAKLWEKKQITRDEGERLVAFTTTSDPIFLIGAVSVGFFQLPAVALMLAIAHYGAGLIVGLLMRFHGKKDSHSTAESSPSDVKSHRLRAAFEAMHEARIEDGRTMGELLRQAIQSSLQLITVVGGLVVFFCVILEVFTQAGLMAGMYHTVELMLKTLGLPPEISQALVGGLFEVTLGARYAGTLADIPLMYKVAAAACVLSWGGLSVHAQVVSILNPTPLRYAPFLMARLVHALLSGMIVFLCWELVMPDQSTSSFMLWPDHFHSLPYPSAIFQAVPYQIALTLVIIFFLFVLTLVCILLQRLASRFR